MLVKLSRTFFVAGQRFRKGVQEIPEHINSIPVIFANEPRPEGKYYVLPLDARPVAEKARPKAPATPVALSQLGKQPTKTQIEALIGDDED